MSSDEDDSPKARVVIKAPCSICKEVEHKYRCPKCSVLTCSLACVKAHKSEGLGCSGIKEVIPAGAHALGVSGMTLSTIQGDMRMLEQGINLSNSAKKENCLARVGASMKLGVKP